MNKIFTIGHSTNTIETFIECLKHHQIDTVVDVRSIPYSRFASQFNKEDISVSLKEKNIFYIPMGNNLGARYEEKELLFEDGKVDFSKVIITKIYQEGICRVERGIKKGYKIVLMCSEENPENCHRRHLIAKRLIKEGLKVMHIRKNGVIIEENNYNFKSGNQQRLF